jgi:hypothetical protein
MNYKEKFDPRTGGGLMSALAVHNFEDQYNDAGYPQSPTLLKKAGDKKVLFNMKLSIDDALRGK